MCLKEGDVVLVTNTDSNGNPIEEGFATIKKVTKRLDMYMVKFIDDKNGELVLRYITPEQLVKV